MSNNISTSETKVEKVCTTDNTGEPIFRLCVHEKIYICALTASADEIDAKLRQEALDCPNKGMTPIEVDENCYIRCNYDRTKILRNYAIDQNP